MEGGGGGKHTPPVLHQPKKPGANRVKLKTVMSESGFSHFPFLSIFQELPLQLFLRLKDNS